MTDWALTQERFRDADFYRRTGMEKRSPPLDISDGTVGAGDRSRGVKKEGMLGSRKLLANEQRLNSKLMLMRMLHLKRTKQVSVLSFIFYSFLRFSFFFFF